MDQLRINETTPINQPTEVQKTQEADEGFKFTLASKV